MGQSYSETRDAEGRTTLVLQDDPPVILFVCSLAGVAPAFFFGEAALWFALANLLVFGSLSAWFTFARRRMQVTIDRGGGTLAVDSGRRRRVLALGDVLRAQVASGSQAGAKAHRVDLVLRSGEVLRLYAGLGGFRAEDCQRMADRINAALA